MIKKKSAGITPRKTPQKSDGFYHFAVQGKPQPKQRPRRNRAGKFYTPKETKKYEHWVKVSFMSVYAPVLDKEHEWEVEIEINTKKNMDGDNVLKSILDGLTGVLWMNDSKKQVRKAGFTFIDSDEKPCVYIKAWIYKEE